MNSLFRLPTFVKATCASLLLVAIVAISVHLLSPPARAPHRPVTKPSVPATRIAPKPARPAPPILKQSGSSTSLQGTNWIQSIPSGCKLPFYQLRMNPEDLSQLEYNPRSNDRLPATFFAGGVTYDQVGVRDRGDWARTWHKKSLKIFFDKDKPFEKQHVLNLNSGWRDPAFVREPLAYHIYAACGAPSLRCRMVRLHLNAQFRGLYVEVEQPDKPFLHRYNLEGGSIYKAVSKSRQSDERNLGSPEAYARHYEKETRKTEGFEELYAFCKELEQTTNVLDFFTRRVDLDKYVNYLAASVLVQHWDWPSKNHFLVCDSRNSKKWLVVPWDLDRTCGDHWHGYFTETRLPILLGTRSHPSTIGWNRMMESFLSEPSFRARFLARLAELLEKEFTPERLFPVLERWESEIASDAALDRQRWGGGEGEALRSAILQLKLYIKQRRAYLLSELSRLR